jgi:hypothetical protein
MVAFDYLTTAHDGTHRCLATFDPSLTRVRLTFQIDLDAGVGTVFVNRRRQPGNALSPDWPVRGGGVTPGQQMDAPDGFLPFAFGAAMGGVNFLPQHEPTFTIWGFRFCRSAVYVTDPKRLPAGSRPSAQVLASSPATPVNDEIQFFTGGPRAPQVIALLPLADAPNKSWVEADRDGALSCLFWVPPAGGFTDTSNVEITDLTVTGREQPPILIGQHLGLRMERVTSAGASQGRGVLPRFVSYPSTVRDCSFSGTDAAIVAWSELMSGSDLMLAGGRDVFRTAKPFGTFTNVFVQPPPPYCKTVVRMQGGDEGGSLRLVDWMIDDESAVPLTSVIDVTPGVGGSRILVDGLAYGLLHADTPYLRLRQPPWTRNHQKVEFRNYGLQGGGGTVAVVEPGTWWYGTIEGVPGAVPPTPPVSDKVRRAAP